MGSGNHDVRKALIDYLIRHGVIRPPLIPKGAKL